jgi:hypothetical protein
LNSSLRPTINGLSRALLDEIRSFADDDAKVMTHASFSGQRSLNQQREVNSEDVDEPTLGISVATDNIFILFITSGGGGEYSSVTRYFYD